MLIEISAATLHGDGSGLLIDVNGSGSTVRGLVIDKDWQAGIDLANSSNNLIEGCFIGIDPTGSSAQPATTGINIEFGGNSSNNTFGGAFPDKRNLISGNSNGIVIKSGTNNVVEGNFFGTDRTGTTAIPNTQGLDVSFSSNNRIGGSDVGARNVIAGGLGTAISIGSGGGNSIQGNFIGTDVTGTNALGSSQAGIRLTTGSGTTQVGGLTSTPGAPPGNVISANHGGGIVVDDNVANAVIQGNLIGTDASGTLPLGNSPDGVRFVSSFNVVGGSSVTARNVISANSSNGIVMGTGDVATHDNLVQGNFIGTDITGGNLLGNGDNGVEIFASTANTIGGIAGPGTFPGNLIAGNAHNGVFVTAGTSHAILGNAIFANRQLGIDLVSPGAPSGAVTPNDVGDGDEGPNHLQNFPVITSVDTTGGDVKIGGSLDGAPNTTFRIEFFASSECTDPDSFGQGEQFVGAADVTTDGSGHKTFSITFPGVTPIGPLFSATATDPNDNTSEFSVRFPDCDLIFADDFESEDFSRWSSAATDGGNLAVAGVAAMGGTAFGMQAVVNDINALFVEDVHPINEPRYRTRFYLDPNGFDPGETSDHHRLRVLIAFDAASERLVTIVLKRVGGQYSIGGRVRRNDGTRASTPFFSLPAGPHFVEFDWVKATTGQANGTFTLSIDGAAEALLTGIANDANGIDFVHLGAISVKTGAGGTIYLDRFSSRRRNSNGP